MQENWTQKWLGDEYPEIEKRAQHEGGEIHWGFDPALVNPTGAATRRLVKHQ